MPKKGDVSSSKDETGNGASEPPPSHATDDRNNGSPRERQQQRQQQQRQHASKKQRRTKREICDRCRRPVPQTCLCASLPDTPIRLATTEVVVLQHPLELKNHKAASHRSVPLLELCLDASSLVVKTGRRFGPTSLGPEVMSKLWADCGNDGGEGDPGGETDDAQTTGTAEADAVAGISYLPVLVFPKITVAGADSNGGADAGASGRGVGDGGGAGVDPNTANGRTNGDEFDRSRIGRRRYREDDESNTLTLGGLAERWKLENDRAASKAAKKTNPVSESAPPDVGSVVPPDDADGAARESSSTGRAPAFQQETRKKTKTKTKILLLVLDATWKHAREMHLANIGADQYPPHMLRLALSKEDFADKRFVSGRFRLRGKASKTGYHGGKSKAKRKAKRGEDEDGPSIDEAWMSTAECVAWILSELESGKSVGVGRDDGEATGATGSEGSPSLYEILMKPLDAMVAKWNSYRAKGDSNKKNKKDGDDDGNSSNNNNNNDGVGPSPPPPISGTSPAP